MPTYYISSSKMTGCIETDDDGLILSAPNVWAKFVGQDYHRLLNWLKADRVSKICIGKDN